MPLLAFLQVRWVAKVSIWFWFLRKIAAFGLKASPFHPDRAGGLALIGSLQSRFGMLLFPVGIMIASTTFYKIEIENANPWSIAVAGPDAAFLILAPLVFLAPLVVFVPTLSAVKSRATLEYNVLASKCCTEMLQSDHSLRPEKQVEMRENQEVLTTVKGMRIIPFDFGALARLVTAAASPFLPLLLRLLPQAFGFVAEQLPT